MLKIGDQNTEKIYLGISEVEKIYIGDEIIYEASPAITNYVTFTAVEDNSTIGLEKLSTRQALEYSTDGNNWASMTTATTITLSNSGDTCYIRGMLSSGNTDYNYTQFKMTGKIAASGNCNYLWNYNNPDAPLKQYCGYYMFNGCTSLTTAPELPATTLAVNCYYRMFKGCTNLTAAPELPATTLVDYCYYYMFDGCTSLTTAPELPATALATYCYEGMFKNCTGLTTAPELPATTLVTACYYFMFDGCTSLTTAPELPATTLADHCYEYMFRGCTSLTTAPELPATTLADYCYGSMFYNCTSLTAAPELPTTTLTSYCYAYMFYGCSSLNYIKCLAINISASYCTTNWVDGVSNSGTFVKNPAMSGWTTGNNGIPEGWQVADYDAVKFTAEQDNSTIGLACISSGQTLEYSTDGVDWVNMTTATTITLSNNGDCVYIRGVLTGGNWVDRYTQFRMTGKIAASGNCNYLWNYKNPNAGLKVCCGRKMFLNCESLTIAPDLPSVILNDSCYYGMFEGCTSLTSAPELSSTNLETWCYNSMFAGCSSLTLTPALPATTLASGCYDSMFKNCTSLTIAPELPATTLASECYDEMFDGCTSLTTAPELPATTLANYAYYHMFINCTSLKTPPSVLPAFTLKRSCYSMMFAGCTSLNVTPELCARNLNNDYSYYNMFSGCTSLNYIKCLATNISVTNSTENWVCGVSQNGVFVKHPKMNSWTIGNNGIPSGWTVIDSLDAVKFTAEQNNSTIGLSKLSTNQQIWYSTNYDYWFLMTTATTITLANSGDSVYIRGILSGDNSEENYTQFKMTGKISASGNCNYLWNYENPNTSLKVMCGLSMFSGCTSLTTAPELPATTLAEGCYGGMFVDCTSLTTTPELPATTLAVNCYGYMFYGCSNLNYIKCLATDISATNCTSNWINGVSSTGTFVKNPEMSGWTTGDSGIPNGWAVEDADLI